MRWISWSYENILTNKEKAISTCEMAHTKYYWYTASEEKKRGKKHHSFQNQRLIIHHRLNPRLNSIRWIQSYNPRRVTSQHDGSCSSSASHATAVRVDATRQHAALRAQRTHRQRTEPRFPGARRFPERPQAFPLQPAGPASCSQTGSWPAAGFRPAKPISRTAETISPTRASHGIDLVKINVP